MVSSLFIEDDELKEYSILIDVKRKTPVGISFENGPFAGHLRRAVKGLSKEAVPSNKYKHPYIRFKDKAGEQKQEQQSETD